MSAAIVSIIILSSAVGILMLILLSRYLPDPWKISDPPSSMSTLSLLCQLIFGLALAMSAVTAWGNIKTASQNAAQEADGLAGVYWSASNFSDAEKEKIQGLVRSYTTLVVEKEWPLMREGKTSPTAWDTLDQLRRETYALRPRTPFEENMQTNMIENAREVSVMRRQRALDVDSGLPGVMWGALIIAGGLNIVVPLLINTRLTGRTAIAQGLTAAVAVGALLVVYEVSHPFSQGVSVSPGSFTQLQDRFTNI